MASSTPTTEVEPSRSPESESALETARHQLVRAASIIDLDENVLTRLQHAREYIGQQRITKQNPFPCG